MLSHFSGFFWKDVFEEALHYIASIWLSRMDSTNTDETNFVIINYGRISDSE